MGAASIGSAGVRAMMRRELQASTGIAWVDAIAGPPINSTSRIETYPFIGQAPQMIEWIGSRQKKDFNEDSLTVENSHFETTIIVRKEEMARDKTDSLRLRIREMSRKPQIHWASHLSSLILAGESTACYDDQFYFDTDHVTGDSGTQSNDLSVDISALPAEVHGTVTNPSPEEAQQVILQGVSQITGFKDDRGEPMNEDATNFIVMTGAGLAPAVRSALTKDVAVSSSTFDFGGFSITQVTNVRLNASTDKIYIFRTDGIAKPFLRQQEGQVNFTSKAEGSDFEHDYHAHEYGYDVWRKAFYAYWQDACLVTMT